MSALGIQATAAPRLRRSAAKLSVPSANLLLRAKAELAARAGTGSAGKTHFMKHRKQPNLSRTTNSRARRQKEEADAPVRDWLIARLVRALRSNPHGLRGPLVISFVTTAMAKSARGWRPNGPERLSRVESLEWTRAVLIFLASFSIDLREKDPEVSADATWALAQIDLTAEQVTAADGPELDRLAKLAWVEDSAPPSRSKARRSGRRRSRRRKSG